jgi:hypothetical protein
MFDIDISILDIKKAGIEPVADDEIFVQVHNTINYWISNYGRLVNNLRKKFYLHKVGDVHWTIQGYYLAGVKCPRDTYPSELVAEHFLEKVKGKNRIWIIDGNRASNYYKNLIYVDDQEYYDLNIGKSKFEDLGRSQEYVPYINVHKNRAMQIYNGIYMRCYDSELKKKYPHYEETTMHKGWHKDPEVFCDWYEFNYYKCDNEQMVVDKDLLFKGNKEYAPDKCCILPWTLNVMLSNCKKHYNRSDSILKRKESGLPLGVRYDESRNKYYGQIKMDKLLSCDSEVITLNYWGTQEEAFSEYKRHKEAYILIMADKYKNKVPKFIYDALLRLTVEPY